MAESGDKKKHKILFIVNPVSGDIRKSDLPEMIEGYAGKQGFEYEIFETRGKGDLKRLCNRMDACAFTLAVAAGGDGTCNLVARAIKDRAIAMGIIPMGSANGMAVELGIPQNKDRALKVLTGGQERLLDYLIINDRHLSLHLSDIGMNARVVKRVAREKSRGFFGYFKQYLREFRFAHSMRYEISTGEDLHYTGKARMIILANARKYGTGAMINPAGDPGDGIFELVIIKPYPRMHIFRMLASIFIGKTDESKYIRIIPARECTIRFSIRQDLQVDGEFKGTVEEVRAVIRGGEIRMVVPGRS